MRDVLERERSAGRHRVLDPFVGSGTVSLESEMAGLASIGLEAHPFIVRVAQAKHQWRAAPGAFEEYGRGVLAAADEIFVPIDDAPALIQKCFERESYSRLAALIQAWRERDDGSPLSELTWLAAISIIRSCSTAGTAQWQYVLPNKEKKKVADPFDAFREKVASMAADMRIRQHGPAGPPAIVANDDARTCEAVDDGWADLIITSPPYANNYDYADATRLELTVLGEIERWRDLHDVIRQHLLPSCTQHVAKQRAETFEMLEDPLLDPIKPQIVQVCRKLADLSTERKGRKAYHTLIAAYFRNMARVWKQLRRVTAEGGRVCFVVGDSAPYGVYVPVDEWLGELAVASGFNAYSFEKTRDRNVKWKNRKHRVPLHEGRLWVEG
ncbi:MAG: DNA modification methylase [Bacteroidota bacterium]